MVVYLGWCYMHVDGQLISADFIEVQIKHTQEMIDDPSRFSPDTFAFQLEFLTGYVDYHIKSLNGSLIEWVVRRDYQQTLTNSLIYFRAQTGKDLGGDPQAWIKFYRPSDAAQPNR